MAKESLSKVFQNKLINTAYSFFDNLTLGEFPLSCNDYQIIFDGENVKLLWTGYFIDDDLFSQDCSLCQENRTFECKIKSKTDEIEYLNHDSDGGCPLFEIYNEKCPEEYKEPLKTIFQEGTFGATNEDFSHLVFEDDDTRDLFNEVSEF